MLKTLFSSLSVYKNVLIAAAFVAVLSFAGVQTARLTFAASDIKVLTAEKGGLTALVSAQNTGIKAVADKGKALDAAAERARVAVNKLTSAAEARAKALEQAPVPASCPRLSNFLYVMLPGVGYDDRAG